jgi:hypothetical protein
VLHQEGWRKPVSDLFGKRGRQWLAGLELSPAGRRVVDTYLGLLEQWNAAIAEQDEQLSRLAAADARAGWLQTIPGIGAYSAMVILAEVGEIGRFADKKALASYAGLVPRVRESAGKRSFGGIGRQGSGTLRWIMLQVAQVAARHSPAVRSYQEHLRRKKRGQVAKVAVARKLLCCVWALLQHGVCYDDEVFAAGSEAGPDDAATMRFLRRVQRPCQRRRCASWKSLRDSHFRTARRRRRRTIFATVARKSRPARSILCPPRTFSDRAPEFRINLVCCEHE